MKIYLLFKPVLDQMSIKALADVLSILASLVSLIRASETAVRSGPREVEPAPLVPEGNDSAETLERTHADMEQLARMALREDMRLEWRAPRPNEEELHRIRSGLLRLRAIGILNDRGLASLTAMLREGDEVRPIDLP